MRKILKTACIAIALNLLPQISSANGEQIVFSKSGVQKNNAIHKTSIHLSESKEPVFVNFYLYMGQKNSSGDCISGEMINEFHSLVWDASSMGFDSDEFTGPLNTRSCAIEQYHVSGSGIIRSIQYNLINDGVRVTATNPYSQDVTL